jgi:hypothetical protein
MSNLVEPATKKTAARSPAMIHKTVFMRFLPSGACRIVALIRVVREPDLRLDPHGRAGECAFIGYLGPAGSVITHDGTRSMEVTRWPSQVPAKP